MNKTNLTKHPCENKCTEFKSEQCRNCLINDEGQEKVVALFVSDVDLHYQRALEANNEVS